MSDVLAQSLIREGLAEAPGTTDQTAAWFNRWAVHGRLLFKLLPYLRLRSPIFRRAVTRH